MKTITVQIGNSDDKLTQSQWKDFVNEVHFAVKSYGFIHFSAPSVGWADWQNACWVFTLEDDRYAPSLMSRLISIRIKYGQESLAWTMGDVEFI